MKAETGYSSYDDEYLEPYSARPSCLERVLDLGPGSILPSRVFNLTLLDLSHDENSQPRIVLRCKSISVPGIVAALRQPRANVALQIVLWMSSICNNREIVDALGLGLKIDSCFFEAFRSKSRRRDWNPKHVKIAGTVGL